MFHARVVRAAYDTPRSTAVVLQPAVSAAALVLAGEYTGRQRRP